MVRFFVEMGVDDKSMYYYEYVGDYEMNLYATSSKIHSNTYVNLTNMDGYKVAIKK